jgi:hypothetical protein
LEKNVGFVFFLGVVVLAVAETSLMEVRGILHYEHRELPPDAAKPVDVSDHVR